MASFPKPPSADDTVQMDRLPDFDQLETLVEDARKASESPDATLRMPALKLPPPPPATAAHAKPPAENKTVLRPPGAAKVEDKTMLRPSVAPDPPKSAKAPSTARMRAPLDQLPKTIVDFGGDKASVAPVAMPTFDAPSTPSAWPSAQGSDYKIPRRTWPITVLTLVAVFASFVMLGAAIVTAWDKVPPGIAHAAASTLVIPPRAVPSASSPLEPLTPSSASARPPAPRPHAASDVHTAPAKPAQVSDNPYEEGSTATPAPSPGSPATAPADTARPTNEADKKLEDLVRSLQR